MSLPLVSGRNVPGKRNADYIAGKGRIPRRSVLSIILVALFAAGCTSTYFVRIDPHAPLELAKGEGLLVLQIDTDLPIRQLVWTSLTISEPIAVGKHLWVAKVRAGRQSWYSVAIDGKKPSAGRYRIRKSIYPRRGELDFTIKAGSINYAGELIVRDAGRSGIRSWISIRIRNHAAMALRDLERMYGHILDTYPLRTAGTSGDAFLEFYAAERERVGRRRPVEQIGVAPQ